MIIISQENKILFHNLESIHSLHFIIFTITNNKNIIYYIFIYIYNFLNIQLDSMLCVSVYEPFFPMDL